MSKLLGVSAYIVKKLWLSLAILLVLFAVLLSMLRYSLPHLQDKKYLLEDYLQSQYGIALTIETVHAVWQGTGPSIVLNNVRLAQNQSSPVELNVEQVYVEVDFWQSITQRVLSSKRFDLVGLDLTIDSERLKGGKDGDFPIIDALRSLFLDQLQSFSLVDGEVALMTSQETQVVELSQLLWVNEGERHQGRGEIRVQELARNSASFILDLYGDKRNLNGTFYAKGEELDISPWLGAWLPTKLPLKESRGNFEVWATLEADQINSVMFEFHDSEIAWEIGGESALQTRIRGGSIQAQPAGDDWSIRVDQLVMEAGSSSMVTDFIGKVTRDGTVLVNTVKPIALKPLLSLTPLFMAQGTSNIVPKMRPEAELATLQLQFKDKQVSAAAKLLNMRWDEYQLLPGLNAIDASFYWAGNKGALLIDGDNVALSTSNLLDQDIQLDTFRANAYVYQDLTQNWVLELQDVALANATLSLEQSVRYQFGDSTLSILTDIGRIAVENVPALFPEPLMGSGTSSYLTGALTGKGEVKSGTILWQGNPADFPFEKDQGVFQAQVVVSDSEFKFAPDWPVLADLDMRLLFVNDSLVMTSPKSRLMDVELNDLRARIPKLVGSAILSIDAEGKATGEQVAALMQNSGIKASLGEALTAGAVVTGPLTTQLNLAIPLNGSEVIASGVANLSNNSVYIPSIDMQLANASGAVSFTNANISAEGLKGELLSQPISVDLSGNMLNDTYMLNIQLRGDWDVAPLIDRFNPSLGEYLTGGSRWQGDVSVALPETGFSYTATIKSDLIGVTSILPSPFTKVRSDTKTLMVVADGNQQASNVTATLGRDVKFNGVLPHQEKQFSRAHLALGNTDFVGLGVGFSISAELDVVNVSDWYKAIELLISGFSSEKPALASSPAIFSVPERIFIEASNLVIAEQTLTDVNITAKQQNQNWTLDIASEEAKAEVSLFGEWLDKGIDIDADFIHFNRWENTQQVTEHQWQADELPPIRFHCGNCILLDKNFGEVDLEVVRHEQGMEIKRLDAISKNGELRATGIWYQDDLGSTSSLTGVAQSDDIGAMLQEFGLNTGIKDSESEMTFNFKWDKSPLDFSFETLDGAIDWRLTDGYLTQLSDKGSRIFTLFSLNSLVRKLSLDFRDVFAKGFFYDDMKGSVQIKNGVADTQDTVIDGGAGEIEIEGYTDLVKKELNYAVSFTPNVTGNLPFLVYFMVNPPTAIAALALDQVLTSAKVISNVNYRVTGTLDEPVFNEVGRDSKDIELPAQHTPKTDTDVLNESDISKDTEE